LGHPDFIGQVGMAIQHLESFTSASEGLILPLL
jgi:hypothetical protein